MKRSKTSLCKVLLLGCLMMPIEGWAQTRIGTRDALSQVTNRVDPAVPPDAAAAKAGGRVVADVVIRPNGTVESVEILGGHEMLHQVTIEALRQWTFKPFIENGKPVRIITLIEVPFPDPVQDEERRNYEAHQSSEYECRRQMESSPQTAIDACREAARAAEKLPPERRLERTRALQMLGQSLFVNRRFTDALTQYELALDNERSAGSSEVTAGLFVRIARTHSAIGNIKEADSAFVSSIQAWEGMIQRLPAYKDNYIPNLRTTLLLHAELKRFTGDRAAADELTAKADSLTKPAGTANVPPPVSVVNGILCLGRYGSRLTEEDVRQIRTLMPKDASAPWLIIADVMYGNGTKGLWIVDVYLEPDVNEPAFRSGRLIQAATDLPSADVFTGPRTWRQNPEQSKYFQLPVPGRDPKEIRSDRDLNRPARITEIVNAPKFTESEIRSLAGFLRSNAVQGGPAVPRLSTDLQPWTIQNILRWSSGEVEAYLLDPYGTRGQQVRLRLAEGSWTILSLR